MEKGEGGEGLGQWDQLPIHFPFHGRQCVPLEGIVSFLTPSSTLILCQINISCVLNCKLWINKVALLMKAWQHLNYCLSAVYCSLFLTLWSNPCRRVSILTLIPITNQPTVDVYVDLRASRIEEFWLFGESITWVLENSSWLISVILLELVASLASRWRHELLQSGSPLQVDTCLVHQS